jgi:predicted DNA-binding transcriptional regulator AlpA
MTKMMTTFQLAEYLGLKSSTLHNWRCTGHGPTFTKLGRRVVYDLDDVTEWLAQQKHQQTSKKAHA